MCGQRLPGEVVGYQFRPIVQPADEPGEGIHEARAGPVEHLIAVDDGDAIVGDQNAAPPGKEAWWVPNRPLGLAHIGAAWDPRIVADIARRLRGEPAYAGGMPEETGAGGEDVEPGGMPDGRSTSAGRSSR